MRFCCASCFGADDFSDIALRWCAIASIGDGGGDASIGDGGGASIGDGGGGGHQLGTEEVMGTQGVRASSPSPASCQSAPNKSRV